MTIHEIMSIVKEKRILLGISQMYFAEKLEISHSTYSNLESGKTDITVNKLLELIELLKQESLLISKNSTETYNEFENISKQLDILR